MPEYHFFMEEIPTFCKKSENKLSIPNPKTAMYIYNWMCVFYSVHRITLITFCDFFFALAKMIYI